MTNHCGECTACCRVFGVPEVAKPAGKWCQHCAVGHGCRIYDARPKVCRDFACLWLLSQDRAPEERMAPELRPDRSKVVIGPTTLENMVAFAPMPGAWDAWRKPAFQKILQRMRRGGMRAVVNTQDKLRKIVIDRYGEREVTVTEEDDTGMQWYVPPTKEV